MDGRVIDSGWGSSVAVAGVAVWMRVTVETIFNVSVLLKKAKKKKKSKRQKKKGSKKPSFGQYPTEIDETTTKMTAVPSPTPSNRSKIEINPQKPSTDPPSPKKKKTSCKKKKQKKKKKKKI
jgi:hypothetical protein